MELRSCPVFDRPYTIRSTCQVRRNSHAGQVCLIVWRKKRTDRSGDWTTYENFFFLTGQASEPDVCMAVPSGIPEQVSVINLTSSGTFCLFWLNAALKLLCGKLANNLTLF